MIRAALWPVVLTLIAPMAFANAAVPDNDPLRSSLKSSKSPWSFACDEIRLFNKENRTQCRGHVVMRRDDIKITCDLFEAFTDDKKDLRRMVCLENVVMQKAEGTSTSEKAEFEADNQTLTLSGNPIVRQNGNEFKGDVIVYDLKNDRLSVKRVRGKIAGQPNANQPAAGAPKK
jgi:lipopolysaccharide transport protein LptA